jgi:DNA-binding MarR family transcriptional regulator
MNSDPFIATMEKWMNVSMHRSMRNFIHYVRRSGLSMSHMAALLQLHRRGSCGVTELANHLGVTNAATSQLVDRLVEHAFVQREEHPDDRRVKRIKLTDKGKQFMREGIQTRQNWINELSQILSPDEKATIGMALDTLTTKVRELRQTPEPNS